MGHLFCPTASMQRVKCNMRKDMGEDSIGSVKAVYEFDVSMWIVFVLFIEN